jgi:hypothetical protein
MAPQLVVAQGCRAWNKIARAINNTLWPTELRKLWWRTVSCTPEDYDFQ